MTPILTVRPATPADWHAVRALRLDAERRLAGHPSGQWQNRPEALPRLRAYLDTGQLHLAVTPEGDAAGCAALSGPDETLWADEHRHHAVYIGKCISRRGSGAATALLAHADRHARQAGKTLLRLCCWTTNTDLRRYWETLGFALTHTVAGRVDGACLERPVTAAPASTAPRPAER